MKRLKLSKGLSYTMKGFSCVKGVLFDAEDDLAEKLLKTGRFEEAVEEKPDEGPGEKAGEFSGGGQKNRELSVDDIVRMKKDQLIALAAEQGIDIEDCKNNDERIEKLSEAFAAADFIQMVPQD